MLTLLFNTTQVFAADAAETLTPADTVTGTVDASVAESETAGATDTESASATFSNSETENAAATDNETSAATFASSVSETAAAADVEPASAAFANTESESAAPSDAETAVANFASSESEATTPADTETGAAVFGTSESESVTPAASQSASASFNETVSESTAVTDTESLPANLVLSRVNVKLHCQQRGAIQRYLRGIRYRTGLIAYVADMVGASIKEILVEAVTGRQLTNPVIKINLFGSETIIFEADLVDMSNGLWGYSFTDEEFAVFGLYPLTRFVVTVYSNVV